MVNKPPIPISSLAERLAAKPLPGIGSVFSEIVMLGGDTVTKLVWDNFTGFINGNEAVLAGFSVFKKSQYEKDYSMVGFTTETFYYDHLGYVDDFRNLPSYLYLVVSLYRVVGGTPVSYISDTAELDKGVYLLYTLTESNYNEAKLTVGDKTIVYTNPVFLLLVVTRKTSVKFESDTGSKLALMSVGGTSEVVHAMSYDTTDENRLGKYLRVILQEEVRRVKEIYYPNFTEEIIVLSKKRAGEYCPRCFRSGMVLDNNCPVCFGTGFKGGYHAYKTYGQFNFPEERFSIGYQERGEWFGNRTFELLTPPELILRPFDVVVRMDGTRYIVGPVSYTRIARSLIHQKASITLLDRNQPAYQVVVSFAKSVEEVFQDNLNADVIQEVYDILSSLTTAVSGVQYDVTMLNYLVV